MNNRNQINQNKIFRIEFLGFLFNKKINENITLNDRIWIVLWPPSGEVLDGRRLSTFQVE